MRHPRLVLAARAPNRWERSRNVAWNQRFHKLRSYRGLMGPARTRCAAQRRRPEKGLGGAYMAVFAMCASRGWVAEALGGGAEDETNNSKFAKRTWNVPWNQ